MGDRAIIIAALIIGGAIVTSSLQTRTRYALSAADSNVAWRMDTWSGQIDICAAAYLPSGPLVRCGATIVTPVPPSSSPPNNAPGVAPDQPASPQPFALPESQPRDHTSLDGPARL